MMRLMSAPDPAATCWTTIGIFGNRQCDQLEQHVHCRNCPTYRQAGRQLLDRPMPADYRAEVTRQLAAPPPRHAGDLLRLLVFRVGGVWLALPSACFEETLSPVPVVKVPLRSNRHFLGLVNTHGELQLCFTLAHLLGADDDDPQAAPATRASRIFRRLLLVWLQGERWTFQADEVLGTLEYPRSDLEALPANLARASQRLAAALFEFEGYRIKLIDEDRLVGLFREALA